MELASNHSFPRHTHDEYGIGVVLSGAQRSWSGVGAVESLPGDVISVNPGELHDGYPIRGHIRRWRIIYFDPNALRRLLADEAPETEFVHPSLRDPALGGQVNVLFDRLRNGADRLGLEEILARVVPRLISRRAGVVRAAAKQTAPVRKARARIEETLPKISEDICGAGHSEKPLCSLAFFTLQSLRAVRWLVRFDEPSQGFGLTNNGPAILQFYDALALPLAQTAIDFLARSARHLGQFAL